MRGSKHEKFQEMPNEAHRPTVGKTIDGMMSTEALSWKSKTGSWQLWLYDDIVLQEKRLELDKHDTTIWVRSIRKRENENGGWYCLVLHSFKPIRNPLKLYFPKIKKSKVIYERKVSVYKLRWQVELKSYKKWSLENK